MNDLDHVLDTCKLAGEIIPTERGTCTILAAHESPEGDESKMEISELLTERDAGLVIGTLDDIKQALREVLTERDISNGDLQFG